MKKTAFRKLPAAIAALCLAGVLTACSQEAQAGASTPAASDTPAVSATSLEAPASAAPTPAESPSEPVGAETEDPNLLLTSGPAMTLLTGPDFKQEQPVAPYTYQWTLHHSDGTSDSMVACGMHPLDSVSGEHGVKTEEGTTGLSFPVTPDELSIRSWEENQLGLPENSETTFREEIIGAGHTITVEKGRVYEVTAVWNKERGFSGDSSYAFYSTAP